MFFCRLLISVIIYCIFCGDLNAFVIDQRGNVGLWSTIRYSKNIIKTGDYFYLSRPPRGIVVTDPILLKKVALDTLRYINLYEKTHKHILAPCDFTRDLMSLKKVKQTLLFIINVVESDEKIGRRHRILDPAFVKKNFGFIKWSNNSIRVRSNSKRDLQDASETGNVRLTKYTVYNFEGSYHRRGMFRYPLYYLASSVSPPNYTKRQVLAGKLKNHIRNGVVKPLVWLTREGLEEALMQGTIFVHMPDGRLRAFNVHRHNGFAYDRNKGPKQQKRYWYFREVSHIKTRDLLQHYQDRKDVVFAGDIHAVGIGKIIAIVYKNKATNSDEMRLGILADTGSAFKNNLGQLDYFIGVSSSKKALQCSISSYPSSVRAYILYKKGRGYQA